MTYEMSRLLEDRIRMTWEDDRAGLLREVRRLRGAGQRQQRAIDRIQREFDAVKQLVVARQQNKQQGRELTADAVEPRASAESPNSSSVVRVGVKRPRLANEAGDAIGTGAAGGGGGRKEDGLRRTHRGASTTHARATDPAVTVAAARVLPDGVLFMEGEAHSSHKEAVPGSARIIPTIAASPQSAFHVRHDSDLYMSPTIAMTVSDAPPARAEARPVAVVPASPVRSMAASAKSTGPRNDQLEASKQIISKGLSTRRRDVRAMLPGHTCAECEKYINVLLQQGIIQTEEERNAMLQTCSRHKSVDAPPPSTPEGFWDLTVHTPEEWTS